MIHYREREEYESMNPYLKHLDRIEFAVTFACTGRCKHCSEGEHKTGGEYINGETAAAIVEKVCRQYDIKSLMTFGGEPLLHIDEVCRIHSTAKKMKIPKRDIITNGFFSRDENRIHEVGKQLAESGVTAVSLSVDAFHQETIPLEPVKCFAEAVKETGILIRTHPAWLVHKDNRNPYNERTAEILREFEQMGISATKGNNIFPEGNALKYLSEYFDTAQEFVNPYTEDPKDVRAFCVSPNGDVLGGNVYQTDILDILENYSPEGN